MHVGVCLLKGRSASFPSDGPSQSGYPFSEATTMMLRCFGYNGHGRVFYPIQHRTGDGIGGNSRKLAPACVGIRRGSKLSVEYQRRFLEVARVVQANGLRLRRILVNSAAIMWRSNGIALCEPLCSLVDLAYSTRIIKEP